MFKKPLISLGFALVLATVPTVASAQRFHGSGWHGGGDCVDQDGAAEVGAGGGPRSVLASAQGLLALRLGALAGALPGGMLPSLRSER